MPLKQRLETQIVNNIGTSVEVNDNGMLMVQAAGAGGEALATEATLQSLSSQAKTPGILRATGAGSITVLVYDFSVSNVGAANGTLLGQTLKPGETVNFDGGAINNYYPAGTVTYDATGTEFLIIYNS